MNHCDSPHPDSPDVSPLEAHAGFWLRFVSNQVSARFEHSLRERDISVSEWVAMRTLYKRDGVNQAELQNTLGMTKGAISKILSRLENKSLVERRLSADSHRGQLLYLSTAGNHLLPELAAIADNNDACFFACLSDDQRQQLLSIMQTLVTHHQLTTIPAK